MRKRLVLVALVATSTPAAAHDYWISSDQFVVADDRTVSVSMLVGEQLITQEERSFEATRTPRLDVVHAGVTKNVLPLQKEGALPAFTLPLRGHGGHLLVTDRVPAYIELDAEKFEKVYLVPEGLERIIGVRAKLGESAKPGRERYRRNLKALVQVGSDRDDTFAFDAGQELELIPETNPAFASFRDRRTRSRRRASRSASARRSTRTHRSTRARTGSRPRTPPMRCTPSVARQPRHRGCRHEQDPARQLQVIETSVRAK